MVNSNPRHSSSSNLSNYYNHQLQPMHDRHAHSTLESNTSSSRIEDSYLRMLKTKGEKYTKKIHLGGGYEV